MGIELKLTDRELPVSPVFVNFLVHHVEGRDFAGAQWPDQLEEGLNNEQRKLVDEAPKNAEKVMADPRGRQAIARAYQILMALLTGDLNVIRDIQFRLHFVNIIGIPRNGGSYLTAECYRSLGFEPDKVPNAIAHDGFPEAGPFQLRQGVNSWIVSLQTMAEYLTMAEIYFADEKKHSGKIVVPKKLTKGIYAGGFFHRVLGEAVEHIFTARHPVTSCISTYEKSGGLPEDGRFKVRGNIEEWCKRDLLYTGCTEAEIFQMDYFDVYLRYWEQYHVYIATTGLSANRDFRVVAYGKDRMEAQAASFYRRYESTETPGEFKVFDNRDRHPDWMQRAEPSVQRVHDVWKAVGMAFPIDEVMEAW